MSRKLFYLILSLCLSNMVVGQSHSITGRVVSEGEAPIDLANVLLFAVKDTALLQGAITDGFGNFKFTDVVKGRYFIQAALINRKTDLLPINVEHNLNLGTLSLPDAIVLDEVVLTDTKPLIERLPDRIVFNVQGSSMVNEDLWYVLGHTPRVMITGDVLSVQGEGDVGVLINGRLVNLPQQDIINLLSGTSAQGIESIEVITDPPAKYAAEYASIINIKSKKNLVAGHNGSVHYRHRQGTYPKAALGTDHFFKGRKTGFSFSYTYQDDRELNRYMDQTDFFGDGVSSHWEVRQKRDRKRDRHNLNLFFDYDFDARNRLSISSLGYYAPKRNTLYFSHSNVAETLPSPSNYDNYTDNLKVEDRFINSYYIDFVHDYEEKGKTLSLTAHYTQDAKGMSQDVQSDTYGSDGNLTDSYAFDIDSDVGIGLFSSQVDFTRPLAHGKWETGARFSSIASDVDLYQDGSFPPSQGEFVESALFQYREQIYAGYFSYNHDKGPWKTGMGLRVEHTTTKGILDENGVLDRDYLKLFPNLNVQYKIHKDHLLTANVYRRITRPKYERLRPFRLFYGINLTIEGNPELRPSTRYYSSLEYTYKNRYSIRTFYRYQKDPMFQGIFQDNENELIRYVYQNGIFSKRYGIVMDTDQKIGKHWSFYLSFIGSRNHIRFTGLDGTRAFDNETWYWGASTNQYFNFLTDKSLTADVSYAYYGTFINGNLKVRPYGELDVNIRKTFLNKRTSLSLGIMDVFNDGKQVYVIDYDDQHSISRSIPETRLLTLGFRHKFGNNLIKSNKRKKSTEEKSRL